MAEQISAPPSRESHGHRDGLWRRRRALVALVAGSIALTGLGATAATLIKSPAQAAAETQAPPPDVLTAPVERKVLSDVVVARGQVVASQSVQVSGEGVGGKDVGRSVVTRVKVKPGQSLTIGQVLLEISGRPVFVLRGALPSYRDLTSGSTGEDVAQLQQALAAIGHSSGNDRSGEFGPGTEDAVTAFYRAKGFDPPQRQTPPSATGEGGSPSGAAAGPDSGTGPGAEPPAAPDSAAAGAADTHAVVPLAEVVFVRSEKAYVDEVAAQVGDDAGPELLTVSAGSLVVKGAVAPDARGLLRPGQKVDIASETTGQQATGTVESVAAKPSSPPKDSGQPAGESYAVKVKPTSPLSADLVGEDVRLTITAASSAGAVLAVPVSAISAGASGQTTVTVRRGRTEHRVPVRTGMTANGHVEITPVVKSALAAGDQVIVGVDTRISAGGE